MKLFMLVKLLGVISRSFEHEKVEEFRCGSAAERVDCER